MEQCTTAKGWGEFPIRRGERGVTSDVLFARGTRALRRASSDARSRGQSEATPLGREQRASLEGSFIELTGYPISHRRVDYSPFVRQATKRGMSFLYPGHSEWCFPVVLDNWDNFGETFLLKKKSKLLCKILEKINTDIHLCIGR